eukprot:TRINITY_DN81968_c0_g1_i1.p1 TRINITY_DN81968_c0_g1~~TRINITY_DN81968_c0_g1_i1.p1  ORF type:complete len:372 (-),score=132.93 TRINITY_DN81968_c0_g1_i1:267-1382(-)
MLAASDLAFVAPSAAQPLSGVQPATLAALQRSGLPAQLPESPSASASGAMAAAAAASVLGLAAASRAAGRSLRRRGGGHMQRLGRRGVAMAAAPEDRVYSLADQTARFQRAKDEKNGRYLDISSVYDGSYLKGKTVLIVGANKGLGFAVAQELVAQGADLLTTCRKSNADLEGLSGNTILTDVEVTSVDAMNAMASKIAASGKKLDYVIFNAGYFPDITDNLDSVMDGEALKQIDICALGPVRCVAALKKANLLEGCKVAVISSQAGSAEWRKTQNAEEGGDYGHHMSRAACNIGGVLMSEELKKMGVPITMLHPGFNRTGMTAKYSHIWDVEGAVEASEGAKRVLYEVGKIDMASTGKFVNCEDGLQIPW